MSDQTSDNKPTVVFDADEYDDVVVSFVNNDVSRLEEIRKCNHQEIEKLAKLKLKNSYLRQTYVYYFQMRTSVGIIPGEGEPSEEFLNLRKRTRKALMTWAETYSERQLLTGSVAIPRWYSMADELISRHPNKRLAEAWRSAAKELQQVVEIQPRTEGSTVYVPVLVRSFLKNYGTIQTNLMWGLECGLVSSAELEEATKDLREFVLSSCLYLRRDAHPSSVSASTAVSVDSFRRCGLFSYLQTLFILLHEVGHLILDSKGRDALHPAGFGLFRGMETPAISVTHGGVKVVASLSDADKTEIEIDGFAVEALLELKLAERGEVLFAVHRVLELLAMSDATLRREESILGQDAASKEAAHLVSQVGHHTRADGARVLAMAQNFQNRWEAAGYEAANALFSGLYHQYLEWVKNVSEEKIRELLERRKYGY